MSFDPQDNARPWRKDLPEWWDRTPPELRLIRQQNPYWTMWAEMDRNQGVLEKQQRDLEDDASATEPGRAKSASAADVAGLEQGRAKGQRFRTDQRPGSMRISTAIESDGLPEGREEAEQWNKSRKLY